MIVAIVEVGPGLQPVVEFRVGASEGDAVADFCSEYTPPLDPADYFGEDAGALDPLRFWAYDFGSASFVEDLERTQDFLVKCIKDHRDGVRLAVEVLAEYPATSGKMFSCSIASQDNWSKLATLDNQGAVVYPFRVTTHDERDSYELLDAADREAATLTVSIAVLTERAVAEGYISAVLASTTADAARLAADPYLA